MATGMRTDGFAMIPNSLARCGKLTPKALSIYLCLKSHAGTTNRTWLNHKTIGRESNNSLSAVKSGLNELRELGIVTWTARIRLTDGRQTSNNYVIHDSQRFLGGLFTPTPQPPNTYQEEEPFEEQPLNTSPRGRGRVRNTPSENKPATSRQISLIQNLYIELGLEIEDEISCEDLSGLSTLGADELIQELKELKWKIELYG